ncbi:MAG TPA: hypothetical protein VKX30_07755 [Flavobacteriaceae bacterium]|nr:hypothetical protein [Flavobacteriaceae bacterium]
MSSRRNKNVFGSVGIIFGSILLLLIIDYSSKPDNLPLSLKPIESIQTYFFSFAFSSGTIGWILGGLLLIGYLVLCYFLGVWVQKVFSN